jgi:hypothetical protein
MAERSVGPLLYGEGLLFSNSCEVPGSTHISRRHDWERDGLGQPTFVGADGRQGLCCHCSLVQRPTAVPDTCRNILSAPGAPAKDP